MTCCLEGVRGSGRTGRTGRELVLPEGAAPVSADEADYVQLLNMEVLYAVGALKIGSYPSLLLVLPRADPAALKASLAKALKRHPCFAGRIYVDPGSRTFSGKVRLENRGVPFTVVSSAEKSAPAVLEEASMLDFADLPNPSKLIKGAAPLMTVKLTTYKDGSAVLALSRTHALADGSYIWVFLADWAAAARGQALAGAPADGREPFRTALKIDDMEELQTICQEELGTRLVKRPFRHSILMTMMRTMDLVFFAGFSKTTGRTRMTFTFDELDRLKKAATPPPGGPGDGWVTTNEAITAHILLSLGRVLLPRDKTDAITGAQLWMDIRAKLGLPPDAGCGMGFAVARVDVERLVERSLWEVAQVIHEELRSLKTEKIVRTNAMFLGMMGKGLGPDLMFEALQRDFHHPKKGKYDLVLKLNNQSKRSLPDFGPAGGPSAAGLTNAGPSLLYPDPGGMELFLVGDVFNGAPQQKRLEALRLIADTKNL